MLRVRVWTEEQNSNDGTSTDVTYQQFSVLSIATSQAHFDNHHAGLVSCGQWNYEGFSQQLNTTHNTNNIKAVMMRTLFCFSNLALQSFSSLTAQALLSKSDSRLLELRFELSAFSSESLSAQFLRRNSYICPNKTIWHYKLALKTP